MIWLRNFPKPFKQWVAKYQDREETHYSDRKGKSY
jgi:hypothetical protein